MATLYLMRHGQTLFNVLKRKQGWCDSPLTEAGVEQAKRAGAWFVERGISFDHAYSSTSERACDTLELVVPGMPYARLKGLKEWNFGTFEGLTEDTNPPLPYGDFYVPFGGAGDLLVDGGEVARVAHAALQIHGHPSCNGLFGDGFVSTHGFEQGAGSHGERSCHFGRDGLKRTRPQTPHRTGLSRHAKAMDRWFPSFPIGVQGG